MRWVAFLSRVAFVCNLFFILALYIRLSPNVSEILLSSTTIIIGYVLAIYLNAGINIIYAIILLSRKKLKDFVRIWVASLNFIFLLIQACSFILL